MANRLQLKRGSGAPGSIFYAGEPMYDESGKILYIGDNGGTGTGVGSSIASNDAYETILEMLQRSNSATAGAIKFYEDTDNGTNFITLKAPATVTADVTLTLPDGDGDADQIIKTDGSGNLSFVNFLTIDADNGTADPVIPADTITFAGTASEIETTVTNGQIQIGLTDDVVISGNFSSTGITTLASSGGITTTGGDFYIGGSLYVPGGTFLSEDLLVRNISASGITTIAQNLDVNGGADIFGLVELDDVNVSSAATIAGALDVNGGADISGGETTLSSATVSDLTNNRVVIAGTSGSLEDDSNLTYNGTDLSTNSLVVTDLTDNRVLLAGTGGAVEDSANLTFDGSLLTVTGSASVTQDLTVNGNLRVVGTAVTFETQIVKVEDRVLELGLVDGTEPTATTTWDSGVAFNYFQTSAKKSGVVWLNNQFMAMLSELSDGGGTDNDSPQITATAYAPVAAGGLYIGGITAGDEVINSTKEAVNLVFDGGSY